jgi:hypothetical protein
VIADRAIKKHCDGFPKTLPSGGVLAFGATIKDWLPQTARAARTGKGKRRAAALFNAIWPTFGCRMKVIIVLILNIKKLDKGFSSLYR